MIVTRAPLRIPLGGGGTDLPSYYTRFGGFFLSAAIDKYVWVNVNRPAADDLIRVKYSRSEEVATTRELQHDLVRHSMESVGIDRNIEISSMADVAAGTGMGSSGSYLVALLAAFHAMIRDHQPRRALAEQACHIEIELAGHPVGKQDPYVAAYGGINSYEIDASGAVTVTPLQLPPYALEDLQRYTHLYYTGKTRSADAILSVQKRSTELGDQKMIDSLHRTKELGYEIKVALEAGNLERFGACLDAHWQTKRARSPLISDSNVDRMYELARQRGALGGKLMGAGGGGFLMLLTEPATSRKVREALADAGARNMPFTFDVEGGKVLLDAE